LKQVHQSLKSLNVELPDEVHRVFDRMFASDEQIQKPNTLTAWLRCLIIRRKRA